MPNLLLIGVVLVFFAASFRISFFYYILYFFIIVALLARFWIWRAWRTLEIRRDFDDHAFLDETVTLRLRVRNGGRLPLPWVRVEDRLPTRLGALRTGRGEGLAGRDAYRAVVSLLAGETRTLEYSVHAARRGYYPIGPLSVDLGDVFGFYGRSLRTAMPAFLTVYPRIVSLEQLGLPSKSPFGSLRTTEIIYEDPSRVSGVRDYFRGDSLRKVNWKVSAALGRLQVKTYEPAITLDTMLVLNLDQEEYDLAYADGAMELAITTAASLANHLAGLRQPFGLLSNGRDAAARYRSADARRAAPPSPPPGAAAAAADDPGPGGGRGRRAGGPPRAERPPAVGGRPPGRGGAGLRHHRQPGHLPPPPGLAGAPRQGAGALDAGDGGPGPGPAPQRLPPDLPPAPAERAPPLGQHHRGGHLGPGDGAGGGPGQSAQGRLHHRPRPRTLRDAGHLPVGDGRPRASRCTRCAASRTPPSSTSAGCASPCDH